jgi:hypothetical protein
MMLAAPMIASTIPLAIFLLKPTLPMLAVATAIIGLLQGPIDIALFTLRQRRTDPAWTGRAFAVSMSVNYLGSPIGSLAAGVVAARSLEVTLVFGLVTCVAAGILAMAMIPVDG